MLPHGIAYPKQLTTLTKALEDYCREACIEPGTQEYDHARHVVWMLFESGVKTPEELGNGLRLNRFPHPLDQVLTASRFGPLRQLKDPTMLSMRGMAEQKVSRDCRQLAGSCLPAFLRALWPRAHRLALLGVPASLPVLPR